MKKHLYVSLMMMAAISCVKLDEQPDSVIRVEQYYKTSADAISAVNSVYTAALNPGPIEMYNRLFLLAFEIQTDDAKAGGMVTNDDVIAMSSLTQSTTNDRVYELWRGHYEAINKANIAIDKIPAIQMDDSLRARLVNESKFLRGLMYFNMVRLWGDVPLVLHETTSLNRDSFIVKRDPAESVYAQVIKDLTDAENLPLSYEGNDIGRATVGAAKAILAKVYLTRQEWDSAVTKCEEVMGVRGGGYGYALFEQYAEVFNVATKNGKEHIFSVQCQGGNDLGNRLASSCAPVGIPGIAAAGTDEPTDSTYGAYEIFDSKDARREVTFDTQWKSPTNGKVYFNSPHFAKYWDSTTAANPSESNQNIPVIRYAEVLLMYAEALNELNQEPIKAHDAINQVIRRAYGKPIDVPDSTVDLVSLDQSAFREAVYLQRRKELMLEFQRWFDLIRTKRMVEAVHRVGKTNASEKNYLLPIPQREIDLNPALTQNPGW